MEKQRKHYSSEFKYKLVKEVLLTDKTVSSACREYGISTGMYYKWQEQFLASAKNGFESKTEIAEARLTQQKDLEITKLKNVIAELSTDLIELKKKELKLDVNSQIAPDVQKQVIEHLVYLKSKTGFSQKQLLKMYGISKASFHRWQVAKPSNVITRKNPRSLLAEEVEQIVDLRKQYPEQGYKNFSYILMSHGIFVPETTIYKVLRHYNLLGYWYNMVNDPAAKEYKNKPKKIHEHWHTDLAYVKAGSNTYFLIILLDGYSRFLLHWKLLTDMTTNSVADFIQEAKDKYPYENPKLISDNGTCFISREFKKLVSNLNIKQIFTRRNHPQTNGKAERMVKSVRTESLRPNAPQSFNETCYVVENYQYIYNYQRLHAAINYLSPADLFFGRKDEILTLRKQKILQARDLRIKLNKLRNSSLS